MYCFLISIILQFHLKWVKQLNRTDYELGFFIGIASAGFPIDN
ncbi:hypothetical protein Hanom_Chr08g00721851 [Helianthus anomalus]